LSKKGWRFNAAQNGISHAWGLVLMSAIRRFYGAAVTVLVSAWQFSVQMATGFAADRECQRRP
jgi:hypothetical protein